MGSLHASVHYGNHDPLPLVLFHYTSLKCMKMDSKSTSGLDYKAINWKRTSGRELC